MHIFRKLIARRIDWYLKKSCTIIFGWEKVRLRLEFLKNEQNTLFLSLEIFRCRIRLLSEEHFSMKYCLYKPNKAREINLISRTNIYKKKKMGFSLKICRYELVFWCLYCRDTVFVMFSVTLIQLSWMERYVLLKERWLGALWAFG